jgi:hypothetical protein
LLQTCVIGRPVVVKPDFGAAGGEQAPLVVVGLILGQAFEFLRIERDLLALGGVDANGPGPLIEPGIANRHEKRVLPVRSGDREKHRLILSLVDDDPIQVTVRTVVEIEDVDRSKRPTVPAIEIGRSHVHEAAWLLCLMRLVCHRFQSNHAARVDSSGKLNGSV